MAIVICPVCKTVHTTSAIHLGGKDLSAYNCDRCGTFEISRTLEIKLGSQPTNPILSYALRHRTDSGEKILLTTGNFKEIQNSVEYPKTIAERVDKMLKFIYDNPGLVEKGFAMTEYHYGLFGIDNDTMHKQVIRYAHQKRYVNPIAKFADGTAIIELASEGIDRVENTILIDDKIEDIEVVMEKKKKCFLVHGHDSELKHEVARFIEKEMKIEVIILHEQPGRSKTIIEKFEHYSDVDFAVCLFTADDVGSVKKEDIKVENLSHRARQNVVFEAGYFMGKLGRENVLILLDSEVEKPSDSDAINYISTKDDWKYNLSKEIQAIYK